MSPTFSPVSLGGMEKLFMDLLDLEQ